jgi:hypothetical protein
VLTNAQGEASFSKVNELHVVNDGATKHWRESGTLAFGVVTGVLGFFARDWYSRWYRRRQWIKRLRTWTSTVSDYASFIRNSGPLPPWLQDLYKERPEIAAESPILEMLSVFRDLEQMLNAQTLCQPEWERRVARLREIVRSRKPPH